jgi:hypothetical protein
VINLHVLVCSSCRFWEPTARKTDVSEDGYTCPECKQHTMRYRAIAMLQEDDLRKFSK